MRRSAESGMNGKGSLVEIHSACARKVRTGELQTPALSKLSGASMPPCAWPSKNPGSPRICPGTCC